MRRVNQRSVGGDGAKVLDAGDKKAFLKKLWDAAPPKSTTSTSLPSSLKVPMRPSTGTTSANSIGDAMKVNVDDTAASATVPSFGPASGRLNQVVSPVGHSLADFTASPQPRSGRRPDPDLDFIRADYEYHRHRQYSMSQPVTDFYDIFDDTQIVLPENIAEGYHPPDNQQLPGPHDGAVTDEFLLLDHDHEISYHEKMPARRGGGYSLHRRPVTRKKSHIVDSNRPGPEEATNWKDKRKASQFLEENGISPNPNKSLTDQLIDYCETLVKEKKQFQTKKARSRERLGKAVREHEQEKHNWEQPLRDPVADPTDKYRENEMIQNQNQNQKRLDAQAEEHKAALQKQHDEYERTIDEIIVSHEAELEVYHNKVRTLASDLMSQSDDFRPTTDQGLSMKLLDLRNRVKNITIPNNLQIRDAPADGPGGPAAAAGINIHQVPPGLDPTGFVARHGPRDIQYMLRSLVWQTLIDAFFSLPYGFGFLGGQESRGAGHELLLDIHRAWLRLYQDPQLIDNANANANDNDFSGDNLSIYADDPYANNMRSALFQSFLPAVYPEKAAKIKVSGHARQSSCQSVRPADGTAVIGTGLTCSNSGLAPGVAKLYHQHCNKVVATIHRLLNDITNNNTRPEVLEAVPFIVNLAAELGLECGVQRARVKLLIPNRNDVVCEGIEYTDCLGPSSGDSKNSRPLMGVDLVVSPGIVRIGDGRRDMTVRKVLVPCEVFAHST